MRTIRPFARRTALRRQFTLGGTINPDREHLGIGPGHIHERDSLETLTRNKFFHVEKGKSELRVRLGEAGKELIREVREELTTWA